MDVNIEELRNQYPIFCGDALIECGNGWFHPLSMLCKDLIAMGAQEGNTPLYVARIEDALGSLRFVLGGATLPMEERIKQAEEECFFTCSLCGGAGKLRQQKKHGVLCNICVPQE